MKESLLDPSWFRVAELRPRLRSHVKILRQHFRGQLWYVIQDASTGRFHRFTPEAWQLIGPMDGERTLQSIWDTAAERLGDDVPTQGETIRLLHQLHNSDVLQADIRPDMEELLRRYDKNQRNKWMQYLRSPLAIKVPLVDPERALVYFEPLGRFVFGWPGAVLWLLVAVLGVTQVLVNWSEFTGDISGQILTAQNVLLLVVVFPVVKLIHELGHAIAVKRWGGEVHQMGVMFIIFTPIPFVDATAATAFAQKHQRMLVSAAGMLVELFLAALAVLVWSAAETGLVKAAAYNVIFIASVSTLLFNGNPLLRFDAYYILADGIEIPNLAQRSNRYLFYLIQKYVLRLSTVDSPASAPGEIPWFLFYSIASFFYRVLIYFGIALFLATEFFFVGVALAIFATFNVFILPLFKGLKFLFTNPGLRGRRARGIALACVPPTLALLALLATPLPLFTVAEGVVWAPEHSEVRAGTDGFVREVVAAPGEQVRAGDVLVRMEAPIKEAEVKTLQGELAALQAQYVYHRADDWVKAEITRERIEGTKALLERRRAELDELVVRARSDGRFVVPSAIDLPARFAGKGARLGYVLGPGDQTLKVVVTQDEVDLVRSHTRAVHVRRTEQIDTSIVASVTREVPSASLTLPSMALGTEGGGRIAIEPRAEGGTTALQKVFLLDAELSSREAPSFLGSRVYVRFDHGVEPLYRRWYRSLRRVFLSHFDV